MLRRALEAMLPAIFVAFSIAATAQNQRAKYDEEEGPEEDPEQREGDDGEGIAHNDG